MQNKKKENVYLDSCKCHTYGDWSSLLKRYSYMHIVANRYHVLCKLLKCEKIHRAKLSIN